MTNNNDETQRYPNEVRSLEEAKALLDKNEQKVNKIIDSIESTKQMESIKVSDNKNAND